MPVTMILNKGVFLRIAAILLYFALPVATGATVKPQVISMPYGHNSRIVYNLQTGIYNVFSDGQLRFSNVSAACQVNGSDVLAAGAISRTCSIVALNDGFGKGNKYIIRLTVKGQPSVEQVFYVYPGRDFFLTQLILTGRQLSSNSMKPFLAHIPAVTGDVRSLFVPFDNDTFISYNAQPFNPPFTGTSAEVGVIYNDENREGYIVGSAEHEVWKTGVTTIRNKQSGNEINAWAGYTDEKITRDGIGHGMVKGDTVKSPKIFVAYYRDWRSGMEAYANSNKIAEPRFVFNWDKPTPVGWNSWGVLKDKLTYDKAISVVNFFADSLPGFRTGNTAFIDLDSFWDIMVKGGTGGDYSQLQAFADYCKSKGLQPGVYWAPFTDWGWKGGAARQVTGTGYTYGELWTKVGNGYHDIDGARALDPTHPGTLKRIDLMVGKLKACGFKMIKIDFLGHAAAESTQFYDPTVTTGMQAYRVGMEHLIKDLDGQMLVYAAISPSLATGRYAHMRRIACDAFKTVNDTRYTLNSVSYGWWLGGLYNYIDADHVVLATETEATNRCRILSALVTGSFMTGDNFAEHGQWSAQAIKNYQNPELLKLIRNGKAFLPVEGNTGTSASSLFIQKIGKDYYLAVFNYGNEAKNYTIDETRLGIDQPVATTIGVFDGILKKIEKKTFGVDLNGGDAALYILRQSLNK